MIWNTKLSVKFIHKTEPTAKDPEICLRKIGGTKRETQNGENNLQDLEKLELIKEENIMIFLISIFR